MVIWIGQFQNQRVVKSTADIWYYAKHIKKFNIIEKFNFGMQCNPYTTYQKFFSVF